MLRKIPLFLFTTALVYASGLNYAVSNKHSFVLPKNTLEIKASYLTNAIDVLNLKEKEYKSLGSIGDMDGYSFELRYGISTRDSIFVSTQRWNVNYGDSTLKNKKYDIFNRYLLIHRPYSFINNVSVDVGVAQDSSSDIEVSSDKYLNALVKKIKPDSDVVFNDGDIILGDTTISIYDKNGNKIHPHLSINNLSSRSYYGRLLFGKTFSPSSILDFYLGFKYTTITTAISFYPNNISFLNDMMSNYEIPDMDRDEENINIGFSYLLESGKLIYEFNYEYNKMLRDSDVSYIDHNHIIDASIAMNMTKNTLVYIGGRLMMEQFNSDIPYLYNKYTKTQFDHKYGFAKFGFIYKFK